MLMASNTGNLITHVGELLYHGHCKKARVYGLKTGTQPARSAKREETDQARGARGP